MKSASYAQHSGVSKCVCTRTSEESDILSVEKRIGWGMGVGRMVMIPAVKYLKDEPILKDITLLYHPKMCKYKL